jgi:RHH-type proline utilization regulon transcriptional repressor/proline dehydrogenase/delta 1-pyrroline-5-carboxylate dehydrogenase
VTHFLSGAEASKFLMGAQVVYEDDVAVAARIGEVQAIRYAASDRVPAAVWQAAAEKGFYIARSPVLMEGRVELLQYLQEQAVCNSYHRYGNLGERDA